MEEFEEVTHAHYCGARMDENTMMSVTQRGKHERKMIENTYLEQYITRAHILPRNVPDWLIESLKKLKDR